MAISEQQLPSSQHHPTPILYNWVKNSEGSPPKPVPPAPAHTDTAGNERVTLLTHLLLFSSVGSSQISAAAEQHKAPHCYLPRSRRGSHGVVDFSLFFFFKWRGEEGEKLELKQAANGGCAHPARLRSTLQTRGGKIHSLVFSRGLCWGRGGGEVGKNREKEDAKG